MSGHFDGWMGVDLDGTLAVYDSWQGPDHIGAPIPAMVERIKAWRRSGREVRIFTARVFAPHDDAARQLDAAIAMRAVQDWCALHLGEILPVTCSKDYGMAELYDDRAVQMIPNTGRRADGQYEL